MTRNGQLALVAVVAALFALVSPAHAIERTFAGSAQVDYLAVPTQPGGDANAGTGNTLDGFTIEAGMKVAVDITSHLSANVKVCYGCHGFEVDMAYFDLRAADELNFRLGRFSPSFGSFNLRHDPANQKLSDKPLPYDMGRMLRNVAWGYSVLPSPFPDTGAEVNGTHWFGKSAQLDYAAYAVAGFRSSGPNALDLNFPQSRTILYVDNNGRPSGGARLALTLKPGDSSDLTLGASGMGGTYDDPNNLTYLILGGDASLRVNRTNIRAEYLIRRTEFTTSDPSLLKYAVPVGQAGGNYFTKQGAYLEVEQPIVRDSLDAIARVDGMLRIGNVAAGSLLRNQSWMVRETLGLAYGIERNLRLKGSVEYYEFSEADLSGNLRDVAIHLGVAGSF